MGEYKPLGSEKLKADEKLKRILELAYYKTNEKKSSDTKPELVKESNNGTYGIVKEKDGYYVKKGLNESSLDYIGGMFMKNKNKFSSYAEALKRLELLKGQEELQEATKYVLKKSSPEGSDAPPADMGTPPPPPADMGTPPPVEGGEVPPAPPAEGGEMPADDMGGMPPSPPAEGGEEGGDSSKRSDYMAEVQKFAGKLGQELRDQHEKMESDDIKYVLNMIISACDLDKLEEEDLEDIAKKFEKEEKEESGDEPSSEEGSEEGDFEDDMSTPPAPPAEGGDEELGETMDKLESFINTPIHTDEVDLSQYEIKEDDEEIKELDMDLIKKDINDSINTTLSKYFK
jgi:hypothetical protein